MANEALTPNPLRAIASYLARRHFGYRSKDCGFGYAGSGGVGQAVRHIGQCFSEKNQPNTSWDVSLMANEALTPNPLPVKRVESGNASLKRTSRRLLGRLTNG